MDKYISKQKKKLKENNNNKKTEVPKDIMYKSLTNICIAKNRITLETDWFISKNKP